MEVYAISFVLENVKPNDDYKPLSELFPLGYRFFT